MTDYIPVEECIPRGVYEVKARNFNVGVYDPGDEDGLQGFIGIREKLGDCYLFTEYHYDTGGNVGTARPVRLLGRIENDNIRLWTRYPGSICAYCGEAVEFRSELRGEWDPETREYTSWPWVHITEAGCSAPVRPWGRGIYYPLFEILEVFEDLVTKWKRENDESE